MPAYRYIVAFAVACLIVIGGFLFCITTNRAVTAHVQRQLKEAEAAGEIPPGSKTDIGVELPDDLMLKMDISHFLSKFGLVLVPGVFVVCLGIAALVGRL